MFQPVQASCPLPWFSPTGRRMLKVAPSSGTDWTEIVPPCFYVMILCEIKSP
jgi:hypothetical protein